MAALTLTALLAKVPALGTDSTYTYTVVDKAIVIADPAADDDYSLTVEFDEAKKTFRLTETKPPSPTGARRFEAGGIFNAAKRTGLRGHMASRRQLKEGLLAFLQRSGWSRTK